MAYDRTASGNLIGGKVLASFLSPMVSLVRVSLSFATAPRSPAFISGRGVCVLPWSSCRVPRRSETSLVRFCTVESDFSDPETTRNIEMRPANGSAIVFQTNADAGALSSALISTSAPDLSAALNGRSAGEGRYDRIVSSSGWMPMFNVADVQTSGNSLADATALCNPATSSSLV